MGDIYTVTLSRMSVSQSLWWPESLGVGWGGERARPRRESRLYVGGRRKGEVWPLEGVPVLLGQRPGTRPVWSEQRGGGGASEAPEPDSGVAVLCRPREASKVSEGGDDGVVKGVPGNASYIRHVSRGCPGAQMLHIRQTSAQRGRLPFWHWRRLALGLLLWVRCRRRLSACHLIGAEAGVGAVMLAPSCRCRSQGIHLQNLPRSYSLSPTAQL